MYIHLVRAKSARPVNRYYPNLGLATIASALKQGNKIEIHDLRSQQYNSYVKYVEQTRPDALGFTSSIDDFSDVLQLSMMCKQASRETKIIIGGPHVSLIGKDALEMSDAIDFLVCGEGEEVSKNLLMAIECKKDFNDVKGIIFRNEQNKIIRTQPPEQYEFDSSPYPAWDLYNLDGFFPVLPVETSRGCPYLCAYCGEGSVYGKKVRTKSINHTIDELKRNKTEFGINFFRFADSTFNFSPKRFQGICKSFIENNLDIKWASYARFETIDIDTINIAKESGCESLYFGVESGSPDILKSLRVSNASLDHMQRIQQRAHDIGIHTHCNFIIGLPFETKDTIKETFELIKKIRPDSVYLSTFFVVPSTDTHINAAKYGIKFLEEDWTKKLHEYFKMPQPSYFLHKTMTQDAMRYYQQQLRSEIEELPDVYWNLKDYPLLTWLSIGGTKEGLKNIWRSPEKCLYLEELSYFEAFKEKEIYDIKYSKDKNSFKDVITSIANKFR